LPTLTYHRRQGKGQVALLRQERKTRMFTGIITDIGTLRAVEQRGDLRARIETGYAVSGIDLGASIACDGVCLTVVAKGQDAEQGGGWFDVDISAESVSKTNLSGWAPGQRVNLERALKVGDELGGHIVSGHVDGLAEVVAMHDDGDSTRVTLRAPKPLARFIAPKGSVALNGTSLTVNEVDGCDFGINFIPHTKKMTTWGDVAVGDSVNLEIDTLARYVARLAEMS
jgi:riboflavin synthase